MDSNSEFHRCPTWIKEMLIFILIALSLSLISITMPFPGLCAEAPDTKRSEDFSPISPINERGWSISLMGGCSGSEALGIEEYCSSFESAITCRITEENFLTLNLSSSKKDTLQPNGIISIKISHTGIFLGSCRHNGSIYYEGAIGYGEVIETVEVNKNPASVYRIEGILLLRGKAGLIIDPVMLFAEISHNKILNTRLLNNNEGQYPIQAGESETTLSYGLDFAINDKIGTALSFTLDPYLSSTSILIFYSPNANLSWESGITLPTSCLLRNPSIMLGVTYIP